jgi:hypothetical protein
VGGQWAALEGVGLEEGEGHGGGGPTRERRRVHHDMGKEKGAQQVRVARCPYCMTGHAIGGPFYVSFMRSSKTTCDC